jgi:hypothetical protein
VKTATVSQMHEGGGGYSSRADLENAGPQSRSIIHTAQIRLSLLAHLDEARVSGRRHESQARASPLGLGMRPPDTAIPSC